MCCSKNHKTKTEEVQTGEATFKKLQTQTGTPNCNYKLRIRNYKVHLKKTLNPTYKQPKLKTKNYKPKLQTTSYKLRTEITNYKQGSCIPGTGKKKLKRNLEAAPPNSKTATPNRKPQLQTRKPQVHTPEYKTATSKCNSKLGNRNSKLQNQQVQL